VEVAGTTESTHGQLLGAQPISNEDIWFSTSRYGTEGAPQPDEVARKDLLLVHAKALGTTRSACGQDTSSWIKHWTTFKPLARGACRRCASVIDGSLPAGNRPRSA
jgi:hypothetical protein